ncbi:MAG: hypothetical protein AAF671_09675 [Pseudomonadota bacterium]
MTSRYRFSPDYRLIVRLSQLTMAAITITWASRADWLSCSVGFCALVISGLPLSLARLGNMRKPTSQVLALLLTAHVGLGMFLGLYEHSALYDKFMHVLGSAAIATLAHSALLAYGERNGLRMPASFIASITLSTTMSAGALWEIFEFSIDQTGLFYAQRGLTDTMIDLVADVFGAALAVPLLLANKGGSASHEPVTEWRSAP